MLDKKYFLISILAIKYLFLLNYEPILETTRYLTFFSQCIDFQSCINPYLNIELLEIVLDGLLGTHRLFAPILGPSVYGFLIGSFEVIWYSPNETFSSKIWLAIHLEYAGPALISTI